MKSSRVMRKWQRLVHQLQLGLANSCDIIKHRLWASRGNLSKYVGELIREWRETTLQCG